MSAAGVEPVVTEAGGRRRRPVATGQTRHAPERTGGRSVRTESDCVHASTRDMLDLASRRVPHWDIPISPDCLVAATWSFGLGR